VRLRAVSELTERRSPSPPDRRALLDLLPGHDACVCMLTDPMTRSVLAAAARGRPRLRLLAQIAVGLDNVDLRAAARHRITVAHTPGVLTDATADLTLALILACARRVLEADRWLREGHWQVWALETLLGLELRGARLGIVGMGRIGRAVARRAAGFGMEIRYFRPTRDATDEQSLRAELGALWMPLPDLVSSSDVLSIHAPLNDRTRHLIDRNALFSMKPGAVLVNSARGPLVDESALVEALQAGRLRAAGLDVFEEEPRVHPGLLDRPDVVLLPHIGSATQKTRHRMAEMAVEAVEALAAGREIPHRAPLPAPVPAPSPTPAEEGAR
jgi:glyoxylate reductase